MTNINDGKGITLDELKELGFVEGKEESYVLEGKDNISLQLSSEEQYRYIDIMMNGDFKGAFEIDDYKWDDLLVIINKVKEGKFLEG